MGFNIYVRIWILQNQILVLQNIYLKNMKESVWKKFDMDPLWRIVNPNLVMLPQKKCCGLGYYLICTYDSHTRVCAWIFLRIMIGSLWQFLGNSLKFFELKLFHKDTSFCCRDICKKNWLIFNICRFISFFSCMNYSFNAKTNCFISRWELS